MLGKSSKYQSSIAIFDSGFGGFVFFKKLIKKMSFENIIYFGDTKNSPYGEKTPQEIIFYALDAIKFLSKKKVKMIILACNSASVHFNILQKKTLVPLFEIITPTVKILTKYSFKRIAILATESTISSGIYEKMILKEHPKTKIYSISCPLFVNLVEEGILEKSIIEKIAKYYLKDLKKKKIDAVLLACTHYIFFKEIIQKILGKIKVIDPSSFCIKQIKKTLEKAPSSNKPKYLLYTSKDVDKFKRIGQKFLKKGEFQWLKRK